MLLFQYLDFLPPIPSELISELEITNSDHYIRQHDKKRKNIPAHMASVFERLNINNTMLDWLRDNISSSFNFAGLQQMTWPDEATPGKRLVIPHTDKERDWAVNYLFEPGGPNVTTTFYQQPNFPLVREYDIFLSPNIVTVHEQFIIEPYRWHLMKSNVLHGVENVETLRQAITLGFVTDDPLSLLKA